MCLSTNAKGKEMATQTNLEITAELQETRLTHSILQDSLNKNGALDEGGKADIICDLIDDCISKMQRLEITLAVREQFASMRVQ
jgi:hypothetical protein